MNNNAQQPLAKTLRSQLETTIKAARQVAEDAARAAILHFGVGDARAPSYLTEDQLALRRRLRAHGRSLGDKKAGDDSQEIQHLVWEVAYEHWHRMLFARFLAENHLLLWEPGAPVTLAECDELAQDASINMGAKSGWELAGKLAARMLPQVFKANSPVFELTFAPEHQRGLERLLGGLNPDVFKASDSLGWVYQFWQSQRKDAVNASEVRIGADELSAVTQLFTDDYMVDFLLHNSLGAWWLSRHPGQSCPVPLTYLRMKEDGTPAGGSFPGWPSTLSEFRLLDPSCGSGHFLVAAFLMLVPMRMAEGLNAFEAVDLVLKENLHGLELDPRCVEIAAFALALAAWRYPDENGIPLGVRTDMPSPNVACCGLAISASPKEWANLVPESATNAAQLRQELMMLHYSFAQAPVLGSLLDPAKALKKDLATSKHETLVEHLDVALSEEGIRRAHAADNDDAWELAVTAKGMLSAAKLLAKRYHLVVTNVPYLASGKHSDELRVFCEANYPDAKLDLANVFLERCRELALDNGQGVVQVVMPQNWLYLFGYRAQRESLLRLSQWNLLAKLGAGAFETISGEVVQVVLFTLTNAPPVDGKPFFAIDASGQKGAPNKANQLKSGGMVELHQRLQLTNPDARFSFEELPPLPLLSTYADGFKGLSTGDLNRFIHKFWELPRITENWVFYQGSVGASAPFSGRSQILLWEQGEGAMVKQPSCYVKGSKAWGRTGVSVAQMSSLAATFYTGEMFDENAAALIPYDRGNLLPIYTYLSSPQYKEDVRKIDAALKVTNKTLVKVPFDIEHWKVEAAKRFPAGLPAPYSDDPTQWIFHGHPTPSKAPLQVAVGRLLGYQWPSEMDDAMPLSDDARYWRDRLCSLAAHKDDDGIVCLPAVRGERPAHERLLALLIDAWESSKAGSWTNAVLEKLLKDAECAGKTLEIWLRDKYFEQHAKLFEHRPFIIQVWDGLPDGFSALVNFHALTNKSLEKLIHTYLGDWIRLQEASVTSGVAGAQFRLAAAENLKVRLNAILEGEKPYDIFIRWKPIEEQPVGWNPDLNDGFRLNIRPFLQAGVLRHGKPPKLNIDFEGSGSKAGKDAKDKGVDADTAPWAAVFGNQRVNNHHLTLAEKQAARKAKGLS